MRLSSPPLVSVQNSQRQRRYRFGVLLPEFCFIQRLLLLRKEDDESHQHQTTRGTPTRMKANGRYQTHQDGHHEDALLDERLLFAPP